MVLEIILFYFIPFILLFLSELLHSLRCEIHRSQISLPINQTYIWNIPTGKITVLSQPEHLENQPSCFKVSPSNDRNNGNLRVGVIATIDDTASTKERQEIQTKKIGNSLQIWFCWIPFDYDNANEYQTKFANKNEYNGNNDPVKNDTKSSPSN